MNQIGYALLVFVVSIFAIGRFIRWDARGINATLGFSFLLALATLLITWK